MRLSLIQVDVSDVNVVVLSHTTAYWLTEMPAAHKATGMLQPLTTPR
jgi:hypothetical protein